MEFGNMERFQKLKSLNSSYFQDVRKLKMYEEMAIIVPKDCLGFS
jgi:hypothetical protein